MLKILDAYGIPPEIVNAIRVMYENTSTLLMTSEGNTDIFQVDTCVLHGNPLVPLFYIIRLASILIT